ncbi:MAG: Gfo/Idh/MocA family oxidoreductase [Planctomycetes bacterium]|nr:Gfo/Idh/MocA family oxidoreductase [Planctomycetota bacterium]
MPQKTKKRKTAGKKTAKPIRVGVIGVGRGQAFASGATDLVGMKLVAICDTWKERLKEVGKRYGVTTYTSYDRFLEHDMDAVILANFFHEHAPFAIKALEAGKHVMSETSCNSTLAEGAALCSAVEKSGLTYMLAENYPYTAFNMEMRRLYQEGEIGDVAYAEGEYNHPMPATSSLAISPGLEHWRNCIPSTYYCTHALAPLVFITDTMPVKVNALSIVHGRDRTQTVRRGDSGSVILCRMSNGAIFRLFGGGTAGHSIWYRLHGTRAAMETTRGPGYFGPEQIRVWREEWRLEPGEVVERTYKPDWPEHADLARRSGHGGGDFWTNFDFAQAIRSGKQPFLDVYRGVAMSSVGILAWKSALEDGAPFDVPDFKKKSSRRAYADDHWSPWPKDAGPGQPPSSILGEQRPTKEGLALARKIWKEIGYHGK